MALTFAHGAVQWLAADAATTVYAVSGLGFQPKALRFYHIGLGSASDAYSATAHARHGMGFATSTSDRRCVGAQSQDAADPTVMTSAYRDDAIAVTVTSTPAVDGLLDLGSITADGFTLVVDDQAPVDLTVFWDAWGGDSITVAQTLEIAEPSGTGNQDYTVTGFTSTDELDQVVMFSGGQSVGASPVVGRLDATFMVGYSTGPTTQNIVAGGNADDGKNDPVSDGYGLAGECLVGFTPTSSAVQATAVLTQFNTNGFRLNWTRRGTTGRTFIALAIKGGYWQAGSATVDSRTLNATVDVTGLSFQPIGVCTCTHMFAASTSGTADAGKIIGLGSGSSTTSRRCMMTWDADNSGACNIFSEMEYDQILAWSAAGVSQEFGMDIAAMNSDGFQLVVDDASAVLSTTLFVGYLTFGNPVESTRPQTHYFHGHG